MSTDIETSGNFYLTRFYGGVERGVCYQIGTSDGKYVQLTVADIVELAGLLDTEKQRSLKSDRSR